MIEYSNAIAISFLSLFGIEKGNGLSTFVTSNAKLLDLKGLISQFFKPPKHDNRGHGAVMTGSTANIDANNNTPDQVNNNNDEVNNNGKDEDNNRHVRSYTSPRAPSICPHCHGFFFLQGTSPSGSGH